MVDAPQTPTPTADIPAAAPAPVAETPTAPVADPTPIEPAAEPAPVADPAPVVEAPVENVLGDAKPKEEVKPDASKPEAKPEGEKTETPPEVKIELPVYDEFKLPENYTADKESLEGFTKILGEIESGKLDHAGYQEMGQKLVDLGTKAVADSINRLNDYYSQYHENQKKEWFESFKSDPEMGGDKLQETVGMLRDVVDNYGGTAEQIAEFRQVMKDTGVGNHPSVTRILYNMAQKINKYTTESDNGSGGTNRIVPAAKPAPSKVKDYQRFYTGSNG